MRRGSREGATLAIVCTVIWGYGMKFIISQTLQEDADAGDDAALFVLLGGSDPSVKRYITKVPDPANLGDQHVVSGKVDDALHFDTRLAAEAAREVIYSGYRDAGWPKVPQWDIETV